MRNVVLASVVALSLTGCISVPDQTRSETAMMMSASAPSNQQSADEAAKAYITSMLIDPWSAQFKFQPYVRNGLMTGDRFGNHIREFGIFECGQVNAKNRMGGYSGWHTFLVHFDPAKPDSVDDGAISNSDYGIGRVDNRCELLYAPSAGLTELNPELAARAAYETAP